MLNLEHRRRSIGPVPRPPVFLSLVCGALRAIRWTGAIGVAVMLSAVLGWLFLRELPQGVIAFLFAIGAGGMFYLTITDLVPKAHERHYEQSAALAIAGCFLLILALVKFI